jgi:hypothetical protein
MTPIISPMVEDVIIGEMASGGQGTGGALWVERYACNGGN